MRSRPSRSPFSPRLMTAGALVLGLMIASCGGSDEASGGDAGSSDGTTATTEFVGTYDIVSDHVVASGLASTSSEMADLAAAPETATDDAVLAVFENWGVYEGTIKQNEPDRYLDLEDALGVFKKSAEGGDAVGMQTAITSFADASAQYLATHPA
jgi:hypothetical protein